MWVLSFSGPYLAWLAPKPSKNGIGEERYQHVAFPNVFGIGKPTTATLREKPFQHLSTCRNPGENNYQATSTISRMRLRSARS